MSDQYRDSAGRTIEGRRTLGLPDYEKPPLGQPPSGLQEQEKKDNYTRNLPFGRDVDTLVLCKNYRHLNEVAKAFGLKARYEVWTSTLLGHRFKKIIWIAGHGESETESAVIEAVIREILRTKLKPDGELFIL